MTIFMQDITATARNMSTLFTIPRYETHFTRIRFTAAGILDDKKLNIACKDFIGTHDFKSFCSTDTDKVGTVRTVYDFSVLREGDIVKFTVSGDGFLYNMVRIMVGTLLFINDGKMELHAIPGIISALDRTAAGKTVPPNGLYLNKVFY